MTNTNETIADIIAEKRRLAEQIRNNLSTVPVRQWDQQAEIKSLEDEADRLDAAHRRERVDCAKLRDALEMVRDAHYTKEVEGELCEGFEVEADDGTGRPLICVVEDALAAPPRNCDRFATIDEARKAHEAICEKYGKCHNGCPLNNEEHYSAFDCFEAWLYATSTEKEGGAK